jgi:hypothetical protein
LDPVIYFSPGRSTDEKAYIWGYRTPKKPMGMDFHFPIPGFFFVIQFLSDFERCLHKSVQKETAVPEATDIHRDR